MGLLCCFLPNKIKTCCHVLGFGFVSFLTVDLFLTEGKKFPGVWSCQEGGETGKVGESSAS